jgi:hypothetical protein
MAERIVLRSPTGRWFCIWVIVSTILIFDGSFISNLLGVPELSYMAIYSSEGVIDTLGGMFAGLACCFFIACMRLTPALGVELSNTGRPARASIYFALAIVCLIMTGEEFSWGGRLVTASAAQGGWGPDFSWAKWVQPKEARLPLAMTYWSAFFLFLGCFLPGLARWSGVFARFAAKQRLAMPSLFVSRVWLVAAILSFYLVFNPGEVLSSGADVSEAFETMMEFMILAWSMEEFRWVRRQRAIGRSRALTAACTAVVAASVALAMYDLSTRGWPATQSQRQFTQGLSADSKSEKQTALEFYQRAVELYPLNDAAHYAMGVLLDSQGRLPEAISCFENAVRIAPGSVDYQISLAAAYVNVWSGPSIRAAIPHLNEAIRMMKKQDERYNQVVELRGSIEQLRQLGDRVARNPDLRAKLDQINKRVPGVNQPAPKESK